MLIFHIITYINLLAIEKALARNFEFNHHHRHYTVFEQHFFRCVNSFTLQNDKNCIMDLNWFPFSKLIFRLSGHALQLNHVYIDCRLL